MVKEHDPPKEAARDKAARKWKNAELRKRLKQAQQKPRLVDSNKETEIAHVVINENGSNGQVERFERKFAREIRTMMEGHVNKNTAIYAAFLEYRKCRLLKEKLRRLKLVQEADGG
jgi:hypothetical protein